MLVDVGDGDRYSKGRNKDVKACTRGVKAFSEEKIHDSLRSTIAVNTGFKAGKGRDGGGIS